MVDQCQGLIGRLLGHDYAPVFDVRPSRSLEVKNMPTASAMVRIIEASADRIYLGHVCHRCGHKIIKEL